MTKTTFPLLLVAAMGCASEVDLPIDPDRGEEAPSDPDPDPDPDPPLPEDEWSRADLSAQGSVQSVVWTTDGAVVAITPRAGEDNPLSGVGRTLTRYGADAAVEWVVDASPTDTFVTLAAVDEGGVVAAIRSDVSSPGGLAWYDAHGNETASWRPSDDLTGGFLYVITSVQVLPDGGVFWVGVTVSTGSSRVAGLLDAERQLQWVASLPVAPAEYSMTGPGYAALTGEGGFVALARYAPDEDRELDKPRGAYLVELGPDGDQRWRTDIVGAPYIDGLGATSSGNLVVTGSFSGAMSAGDLVLESDPYESVHFVAEIDPRGRARGLHPIELPTAPDGAERDFKLQAMTVMGDELVIAGEFFTPNTLHGPDGFRATSHQLDGALLSERIFAVQIAEVNGGGTGPLAIDAAPDGRIAAGGDFGGSVDFGDGVVDGGVDDRGFSLSRPFVTVFESSDREVD